MADSRRNRRKDFNNPHAFVVTDPGTGGAIPPGASGICSLVSAGAETRALAAPSEVGLELCLAMQTDGGAITLTVSAAFNAAGNTIITFNDPMDIAILRSIWNGANLRWRLCCNDGVDLS